MYRKLLTVLLSLLLAVSFVSISLAEFDYAAFEKDETFRVSVDPSAGAFNIAYKDADDEPLGKPVSDGDHFIFIGFDILMLPKAPAVMRGQFAVSGTLINANQLRLQAGDTVYTLGVDSLPSTSVYEGITVVFTPESFPMIEEIIRDQIASLKFRLCGDYDIEGEMPVNLESLQKVYELYKDAGGLEQDFTGLIQRYPAQIQ